MTIRIVSQIGQCTIYSNIQSIGVCGEILCLYDYKGHSVFEVTYGSFKYAVVHMVCDPCNVAKGSNIDIGE